MAGLHSVFPSSSLEDTRQMLPTRQNHGHSPLNSVTETAHPEGYCPGVYPTTLGLLRPPDQSHVIFAGKGWMAGQDTHTITHSAGLSGAQAGSVAHRAI